MRTTAQADIVDKRGNKFELRQITGQAKVHLNVVT